MDVVVSRALCRRSRASCRLSAETFIAPRFRANDIFAGCLTINVVQLSILGTTYLG